MLVIRRFYILTVIGHLEYNAHHQHSCIRWIMQVLAEAVYVICENPSSAFDFNGLMLERWRWNDKVGRVERKSEQVKQSDSFRLEIGVRIT